MKENKKISFGFLLGITAFFLLGAASYTSLMLDSSGNCNQAVNFQRATQLYSLAIATEVYSDGRVITHASDGSAHSSLFSGKQAASSKLTSIANLVASAGVLYNDGADNFSYVASGGSGSGDVVGPSSATDNAVCRFDSTTGKLIQNSQVTISDGGGIAAADTITAPLIDPGTLRLTEKSDPPSPSDNTIYLYSKDKSTITTLYTKDSSGSVRELLNDLTGLANPMTASGDIIYGGTSGAATRLAKGSDGQVLKLASGLPTWAAESGGGSAGVAVLEKTDNYTTSSDFGKLIIFTSSTAAAKTLTLETMASKNGSAPIYVKNESSYNITIDANGSETIDGRLTLILEPGQSVKIVSDNTNARTF